MIKPVGKHLLHEYVTFINLSDAFAVFQTSVITIDIVICRWDGWGMSIKVNHALICHTFYLNLDLNTI